VRLQEREELARKCAQYEQRHVQFQHELRRRDAEYARLQQHLGGALATAGRPRSRRTSTSVSAGGGTSGSSSTSEGGSRAAGR
jgi:Tfp pilus assembly protein FimV